MNQNFDIFNTPEKPQIILTKPTGEEILEIGYYDGFTIKETYNDVNEINFTVYPESLEDYDEIKGKKYVDLPDYGIYLIDDVVEITDGLKESKKIVCKSVDYELSYKHITLEPSVYQLYDVISPEGTLMQRIIDLIPSWSIGSIDVAVADHYRYFDVEDKTLLEFLYSDLEDAFQAVVEIDYFTRTINIVSIENVGSNSDIYISHENLINEIEISEISNEIVTALNVFGGNDLNIRTVNPSGSNKIYNYDYFKTTEWMSQELIDALDDYEVIYSSNQSDYEALLAEYSSENEDLLNLQTELALLQNELTALETLQREIIQGSTSAGTDLSTINNQIINKKVEISSKENEVSNKEDEIDSIVDSLLDITDALSFENNFTEEQIEALDKLTIEYTYQNDAYIITDSMTQVDIQEQAQLLFDDGNDILFRLSQPRFSFEVDVVDFLKLVDYEVFIKQFELATIINLELQDGTIVETRLISYTHDFDENKLTLEFTSKFRTNDPTYLYNELYNKSVDAGVSVSFSKSTWYDYTRNDKDDVTKFINSALDASVNNVTNGVNQDVLIDSNGMRGRQSDGSGGYLDEQWWFVNNQLAFTDDNWDSAKTAIGKIEFDGVEIFGIVGEAIVGRVVASNELRISNENNNFVLDSNGAVLTDASFTMTTSNGKGKIILDPIEGIRVQGNSTGTLTDNFYVDTDGRIKANSIDISGDATFGGDLSAASGTFSGTLLAANGTFTGTLNGVDGNFSGTITASDIISSVITGADISADSFEAEEYIFINTNNPEEGLYLNAFVDMYVKVLDPSGTLEIGPSAKITNTLTVGNDLTVLDDVNVIGKLFVDGEEVTGGSGLTEGDGIDIRNNKISVDMSSEPLSFFINNLISTPRFGANNYTHVDSSTNTVNFRRSNGNLIGRLDFSNGSVISAGSSSSSSSSSGGSSSDDNDSSDGGYISPNPGGPIA